jgi:hypothetical protein
MSPHVDDTLVSKPRQRVSRQALVVRPAEQDSPREVLDKLAHLEASLTSVKGDLGVVKSRGEARKLDARTVAALGAIVLSIAGYVIQDARNTSRLDAEIEMSKTRIANIERVVTANAEARIRTEMELKALREGQDQIRLLLERHDSHTRGAKQAQQ